MDVSADIVRHVGPFTLSAGPRLTLADSDRMNLEFGVSEAGAARNGHVAPYKAGGGVQSVGATAALSYAVTKDITLTIYDRYDRLLGDAADSPITQQFGSENQNTVGVGLTYTFHTGAR